MVLAYLQRGIILVVSDILSLITIALCLVVKVPQIKALWLYKSARGISTLSLYLELASYSVMMMYNFCHEYAFLSYLEYPVLLVQEYVLIYLVLKYKRLLSNEVYTITGVYFLLILAFGYRILPKFLLAILVPFCTPIGATSKIIQLLEILRTKDSTTVSLMTWFLSAFTNLTRIYTVYVDSADTMLLANFTISFALSSAVYLAAYYFKKQKRIVIK